MLRIRVDVRFQEDLSTQRTRLIDNLIKVTHLEPK